VDRYNQYSYQRGTVLVCKAANLGRNDTTMEMFEIFIEQLAVALNDRRR